MNKTYIYTIMCIVALAVTGCQSEDDLPVQHPDGYGVINFSVSPQQVISRATEGYEEYSATKHPSSMGAFGFHDALSAENMIFNNVEFEKSSSNTWSSKNDADKRYWESYASSTSFDFFAYMPYQASNVSLTKVESAEDYTLSMPFSLTDGVLFDVTKAPMICQTPVHTALIQQDIKFYMDQTLTGFRLMFELGTKMDNVRDITIKSVKLKGENMFTSGGTVSRTYTRASNTWTAGDITWSGVSVMTENKEITIANKDAAGNAANLTLNSTAFQQWGSDFYIIPTTGFTPYIEVTYDVTLNGTTDAEGNYTAGETTRSTVSKIQLIKKNFDNYDPTTPGQTGTICPIKIKIVPSYLYVLADADQESGYIIIE